MNEHQLLGLLPGLIVTFSAAGVNALFRRTAPGDSMASWNAWQGAVIVRIFGIIASALLISVAAPRLELAPGQTKAAYLWLLATVVLGIIIDLVISLRFLRPPKKG